MWGGEIKTLVSQYPLFLQQQSLFQLMGGKGTFSLLLGKIHHHPSSKLQQFVQVLQINSVTLLFLPPTEKRLQCQKKNFCEGQHCEKPYFLAYIKSIIFTFIKMHLKKLEPTSFRRLAIKKLKLIIQITCCIHCKTILQVNKSQTKLFIENKYIFINI